MWDLERRRIDLHEVTEWVRGQLRRWGVAVEDLSALAVDGQRARALATELTDRSLCVELRRPLHRALRSMLPELPWGQVWLQTYAHFRILMPGDAVAAVPPHTDYGFGHSLYERNVWLALTDADEPGALRMWTLDRSLRWQVTTGRLEGVLGDLEGLVPVKARQGDAILFTPLHVHGALMPTTSPRLSIDLRLRPRPATRPDMTFSPPHAS